jgi:hypothetical protein
MLYAKVEEVFIFFPCAGNILFPFGIGQYITDFEEENSAGGDWETAKIGLAQCGHPKKFAPSVKVTKFAMGLDLSQISASLGHTSLELHLNTQLKCLSLHTLQHRARACVFNTQTHIYINDIVQIHIYKSAVMRFAYMRILG